MKKSTILLLSFALLFAVAACKKKGSKSSGKAAEATKAAAGESAATAEKELGLKPGLMLSLNIKSLKKTPFYDDILKGVKSDETTGKCMEKALESADSLLLMMDVAAMVADENSEPNMYVAIFGIDSKETIDCIKKMEDSDLKEGKLNGADAFVSEKDGKKYIWAPNDKTIVAVGGKYSEKITPGKDALGKGELKPFGGDKSIAFSVGEVKNPMVSLKEASGMVDFASGLAVDISATLSSEKEAEELEKQYEQGKAMAEPLGMGDLVKNLKFSRKGATLGINLKLSDSEFKGLIEKAKGMGGLSM